MADPTPTSPDDSGRRRSPVPGWVWILLVVVAVGGLAGGGRGGSSATPRCREAPGQPEAFCNTVGELQAVGDISVDVGTGAEGTAGLRNAAAGLRRLAAAEPPAEIRDDLEQLAVAVDEVVAEAEADVGRRPRRARNRSSPRSTSGCASSRRPPTG